MKTISQLPKNQKIQLHWKLHQVANRNKKLFWSDKFVQQVVDEFKHNFQKSYIICKQSQNGNKMFALWKEFSDNNEISYQDIMELLRKIKQQ